MKPRSTPEGYTHDWELFVRGLDGTDISHFVDKVVFTLHDSFPKPKRGKFTKQQFCHFCLIIVFSCFRSDQGTSVCR